MALFSLPVAALSSEPMSSPTATALSELTSIVDKKTPRGKALEDVIYSTLYYGHPDDRKLSETYVVAQAMNGDGRACFALVHSPRITYHLEGEMREKQYWIKQAYLNGNERGKRAYAASILSEQPHKAVEILKAQAQKGNAGVAVFLSGIVGKRWLPGITEQEIITYLEAASHYDPYAMEALADRYRNGDGVTVDLKKAGELQSTVDILKSRMAPPPRL
jgi:TPR repeat protein